MFSGSIGDRVPSATAKARLAPPALILDYLTHALSETRAGHGSGTCVQSAQPRTASPRNLPTDLI
jgi:hypothetical protein